MKETDYQKGKTQRKGPKKHVLNHQRDYGLYNYMNYMKMLKLLFLVQNLYYKS